MGKNYQVLVYMTKKHVCLLLDLFLLLCFFFLNVDMWSALTHLSQNTYSSITQLSEEELFKICDQ